MFAKTRITSLSCASGPRPWFRARSRSAFSRSVVTAWKSEPVPNGGPPLCPCGLLALSAALRNAVSATSSLDSQVTERTLTDAEALEHWRQQVNDYVRVVWL